MGASKVMGAFIVYCQLAWAYSMTGKHFHGICFHPVLLLQPAKRVVGITLRSEVRTVGPLLHLPSKTASNNLTLIDDEHEGFSLRGRGRENNAAKSPLAATFIFCT